MDCDKIVKAINDWLDAKPKIFGLEIFDTPPKSCGCKTCVSLSRLTEEQRIIIDAWEQFAYTSKGKDGNLRYWAGGLSTLEDIECYLRDNRLIDVDGKVTLGGNKNE